MSWSGILDRVAAAFALAFALTACANVLDYGDVQFDDLSEDTDQDADTSSVGDDAGIDATPNGDGALEGSAEAADESQDPCSFIDCGANGACVVQGINTLCECEAGYHAEGLSCVEDAPPDPCDGVSCGANATCQDGVCWCDDGFEGNPDTGCDEPNPLEDQVRAELVEIAMGELGYCEGVDDKSYMQSQPGYWCYDFVAWVYSQSSYPLPSPLSLPTYETSSLPAGWRPEPGDLIKFNIQHYGMVAEVSPDGSVITTVEGNVNSCVMQRSTTDASVEYYGSLDLVF